MSATSGSRFGRSAAGGGAMFDPWSSQTNDLTIDTSHFLARLLALLGSGKDLLAGSQCQDNVSEWYSRSCCWWPGLPVGQHYKVAMSTHCHKSVST